MSDEPDPRLTGRTGVDAVAEMQFHIRHQIDNALNAYTISEEGREALGIPFLTYGEYWRQRFGPQFLDMSTLVRLGTAIEVGLRHYFTGLCSDPVAALRRHGARSTIFQSLVSPAPLVRLFRDELAVDLEANPALREMQWIMANRHLYAHRSGLVDDKYIDDVAALTGEDIRPTLEAEGYPLQDIYWFRPLAQLPAMIESARTFFRELPERPSA